MKTVVETEVRCKKKRRREKEREGKRSRQCKYENDEIEKTHARVHWLEFSDSNFYSAPFYLG